MFGHKLLTIPEPAEALPGRAEATRAGAPLLSQTYMLKGRSCPCYMRPWAQPLMEIRAYFGEQVALYFAWLGYYGYSLTTPTIVLTAAGIYEFVTGQSADDEGWWKPVQVSLAFFLVAWSALYKDGWDVEQQWCATKWGMLEFEEEEADPIAGLGS